MRYFASLLLACLLSVSCLAQSAAIQKLVVNKYWQYSNTIYDKDKREVFHFKTIEGPKDVKEIALYFSPDGTFKEVVNKETRPKPARNGTWRVSSDTLQLQFPNQRWNYKILFMDAKEFQCSMSKG
ncbi:MAG: hypothetical protein JNL72_01405 [Flavipsychrobacter sp.]|nr:hypothetical protein [Flavipsychrobacter sp.]